MKKQTRNLLILTGLSIPILAFGINAALAKTSNAPQVQVSPLHPTFALLDANKENVLNSSNPVSTMQTCGQCHDTNFIQQHSFHSDLGLKDYQNSNYTWNASGGIFGQWDPLTYRYLSQKGDERLDLSTAAWIMLNANRIVGGGPAETSRDGKPLTSLSPDAKNPEASILNKNGQPEAWDWKAWGTIEMNCFVCHLENPNNQLRVSTIKNGNFGDANTATLIGTGIVTDKSLDKWIYNADAFDEEGKLKQDFVKIQDPTNANCAVCHGEVHTDTKQPLTVSACDLNDPQTAMTGQVIAAQKISESGVNLSGKDLLNRSWDIHAERQLKCTSCHYALNNPAHVSETQKAEPSHLTYDPRVLDFGEYLKMPDHNFARGQSAQYNVAPELKGTMRRCENCHDANKAHANWLPYVDKHMNAVACETCHIPQMYAPAIQSYDWTVLTLNNEPHKVCRGVDGNPNSMTSLVTGYKPVLLNRTNIDGNKLLAPYNLITTYYWMYDDANGNRRPVRLVDLEAAYSTNGVYASDIISAFDANKDGQLGKSELVIDSAAKEDAVKARLISIGLNNPHIEGTIQPYSINHDVARGEYAINDCRACHGDNSRVSTPIKLSDYAPYGTTPIFALDHNVNITGEVTKASDGAIYYNPLPSKDKMYVFGSSRVNWIDRFGALLFTVTVLGVFSHGTLRYLSTRKQNLDSKRTERVYMYQSYERFWHWLQTATIVILLFTGLIIHRPDIFGAFSFHGVVIVHNVLAAILAINAALSLFYHLTTGHIRQFIPRPYGFFDDAIEQAMFYVKGIFKGEAHPFAKRPDKKMNPLQQATYFGILNVLLPLQGLTGMLMWGVQRWSAIANWFGGLPFLAPFHSLIAWTFASFIVGHVYLTTTGATPLESIRGMVTGFEEVEVHEEKKEEKKKEVTGKKATSNA